MYRNGVLAHAYVNQPNRFEFCRIIPIWTEPSRIYWFTLSIRQQLKTQQYFPLFHYVLSKNLFF